jgi:ABC-type transporter Mla subunit MlaD
LIFSQNITPFITGTTALEERLNIIDSELAKTSSAAQDLISDNLAAVSGKVDDSLQALDCLSDKITAMSEYVDDEMTTAKIDTVRLSDELKTMSYKLDAGMATVKLEAVQFQC